MKKMVVAAALAVAIGVVSVTPASAASGSTSFSGFTNAGWPAALSATAQADGTGTGFFAYDAFPGGVQTVIGCTDFTKYVSTHTNNPPPDGYPKTILNATNCFEQDTHVRYFVHIEAVDRVGIGKKIEDSLCIVVKLFPGRENPDPLIKDCGAPRKGDVVINQ